MNIMKNFIQNPQIILIHTAVAALAIMVQLNVMISLQIALNQLAVIQVNNMCLRVTAARYAQYLIFHLENASMKVV
jgi:hypothetical protein